jgi:hypothetical protein
VIDAVPQLGTSVIAERVIFVADSGGVDTFVIDRLAGAPVWPTVSAPGRLGKAESPTPANADVATP